MTTYSLSGRDPGSAPADALVLPFHPGCVPGPGVVAASAALGVDLVAAVTAAPAFTGAVGDTLLVVPATAPRRTAPAVVVVGVGEPAGRDASGQQVLDRLRSAGRRAAPLLAGRDRIATTLAAVGQDPAGAVRAVVEGLDAGWYLSPRPGGRPRPASTTPPRAVTLLLPPADARRAVVRAALERALVTADQVHWARTLVETPASDLPTETLAEVFRDEARAAGARATVWSRRRLEQAHFGGVLGVGQGSVHPPQVVEITWGAGRPLGLTGKGIAFDSGGLNLKRNGHEIAWMKADMAGAAAVVGAVAAAARLGLGAAVHAVIPIAENMPSGAALRPGDVLRHPGGTTTEVTDTDCEGRLILADAVAHLRLAKVSGIIDVGTLFDAAGVGPGLWAAMSTDDALVDALLSAGERAGDPGWRLPIVPGYAAMLESPVADVVNCPMGEPDSSVMAAHYLRTFAGGTPWVHIDNGSTAYLERPWDGWPVGATSAPMRALLQLLADRSQG